MVEQSEALGSIGAVDSSTTYDSAPRTQAQLPASIARQAAQPSAQVIANSLAEVNQRLATIGRVMTLNVDAGTGLTVATIKDSRTGDVLEQFPSTDSIHLAQMLAGWASGKNILLDLIA